MTSFDYAVSKIQFLSIIAIEKFIEDNKIWNSTFMFPDQLKVFIFHSPSRMFYVHIESSNCRIAAGSKRKS